MKTTEVIVPAKTEPMALPKDEGSQVMELFQLALAKDGGSVEALGKLVELHERVQRRRAELEFSQSLVDFQGSCPPVPRTSVAEITTKSGRTFKYTFADLEQIIETVRPHLHQRGLSFTFDSETDGTTLRCTCVLRHANGHTISATFSLPTESASAMSEQQKVGAALTFAKRQSLVAVLGLALTDPDPENAVNPAKIGEGQLRTLQALIAETAANEARLLQHFGLSQLSDMPQARYGEAVSMLERKRKSGGAS